jgi:hypothetical protein
MYQELNLVPPILPESQPLPFSKFSRKTGLRRLGYNPLKELLRVTYCGSYSPPLEFSVGITQLLEETQQFFQKKYKSSNGKFVLIGHGIFGLCAGIPAMNRNDGVGGSEIQNDFDFTIIADASTEQIKSLINTSVESIKELDERKYSEPRFGSIRLNWSDPLTGEPYMRVSYRTPGALAKFQDMKALDIHYVSNTQNNPIDYFLRRYALTYSSVFGYPMYVAYTDTNEQLVEKIWQPFPRVHGEQTVHYSFPKDLCMTSKDLDDYEKIRRTISVGARLMFFAGQASLATKGRLAVIPDFEYELFCKAIRAAQGNLTEDTQAHYRRRGDAFLIRTNRIQQTLDADWAVMNFATKNPNDPYYIPRRYYEPKIEPLDDLIMRFNDSGYSSLAYGHDLDRDHIQKLEKIANTPIPNYDRWA